LRLRLQGDLRRGLRLRAKGEGYEYRFGSE